MDTDLLKFFYGERKRDAPRADCNAALTCWPDICAEGDVGNLGASSSASLWSASKPSFTDLSATLKSNPSSSTRHISELRRLSPSRGPKSMPISRSLLDSARESLKARPNPDFTDSAYLHDAKFDGMFGDALDDALLDDKVLAEFDCFETEVGPEWICLERNVAVMPGIVQDIIPPSQQQMPPPPAPPPPPLSVKKEMAEASVSWQAHSTGSLASAARRLSIGTASVAPSSERARPTYSAAPAGSYQHRQLSHCAPCRPCTSEPVPMAMVSAAPESLAPLPGMDKTQHIREAQRAQRHLGKLLNAKKAGGGSSALPYKKALEMLQQRVDQLTEAAEQNKNMQLHLGILQNELQLVAREQQWLCPAQLSDRRLCCSGLVLTSSSTLVSIDQLPGPDAWDNGWDDRVRGLTTLDLLLLHKQWSQRCAMLLPKVEYTGSRFIEQPCNGGPQQQLATLLECYNCFNQHVIALIPEMWMDQINFEMEGMTRLDTPPDYAYMDNLYQTHLPEAHAAILQVRGYYKQALGRLKAEQADLQRQYSQLVAMEQAAVSSSSCCTSGSVASSGLAPAACEISGSSIGLLLKQLQANLQKQGMVSRHCVHAADYAVPMLTVIKAKVLLYPLAVNGQILYRSLEDQN